MRWAQAYLSADTHRVHAHTRTHLHTQKTPPKSPGRPSSGGRCGQRKHIDFLLLLGRGRVVMGVEGYCQLRQRERIGNNGVLRLSGF